MTEMLLWIKILVSGTLLSLVTATTPLTHCGAPCGSSGTVINCAGQPVLPTSAITIEEPLLDSTDIAEKGPQQDFYTGQSYGFEIRPVPSVESTLPSLGLLDTVLEVPINSSPVLMDINEPEEPSMQIRIEAVDDGFHGRTLGTLPDSIQKPVLPAVELLEEKQPEFLTGLSTKIDKIVLPDGTVSNYGSPC